MHHIGNVDMAGANPAVSSILAQADSDFADVRQQRTEQSVVSLKRPRTKRGRARRPALNSSGETLLRMWWNPVDTQRRGRCGRKAVQERGLSSAPFLPE